MEINNGGTKDAAPAFFGENAINFCVYLVVNDLSTLQSARVVTVVPAYFCR